MNKKMKAALAGLAFVAGCEIGIALQLMKMIHKYAVKEGAMNEPLGTEEELAAVKEELAMELAEELDEEEPAAEMPVEEEIAIEEPAEEGSDDKDSVDGDIAAATV